MKMKFLFTLSLLVQHLSDENRGGITKDKLAYVCVSAKRAVILFFCKVYVILCKKGHEVVFVFTQADLKRLKNQSEYALIEAKKPAF